MSSVSKCRVSIALIFAIVATTMVWLILADSSPLHDYFLYHVTVPNIVARLITVPYLIIMVLRPETFDEALAYLLVFVQWFLVGYVIAILFCRNREAASDISIFRN